MAIQRMDRVGVVVDGLESATAFVAELGMELNSYLMCYLPGPGGIADRRDVKV